MWFLPSNRAVAKAQAQMTQKKDGFSFQSSDSLNHRKDQ
jgi:hypothetical protein